MTRCRSCEQRLPRGCKEFCRRCVWLVSVKVADVAPAVEKPKEPAQLVPGTPFIRRALARAA